MTIATRRFPIPIEQEAAKAGDLILVFGQEGFWTAIVIEDPGSPGPTFLFLGGPEVEGFNFPVRGWPSDFTDRPRLARLDLDERVVAPGAEGRAPPTPGALHHGALTIDFEGEPWVALTHYVGPTTLWVSLKSGQFAKDVQGFHFNHWRLDGVAGVDVVALVERKALT